jgi:hypothetical protein
VKCRPPNGSSPPLTWIPRNFVTFRPLAHHIDYLKRDSQQKALPKMDRDNITPSYLLGLRAVVLKAMVIRLRRKTGQDKELRMTLRISIQHIQADTAVVTFAGSLTMEVS